MIPKILLFVAGIIATVWFLFSFIPSFVCFLVFFRREKKKKTAEDVFFPGSYYNPFKERYLAGYEFLGGLEKETLSIEVPKDGLKKKALKKAAGNRANSAVCRENSAVCRENSAVCSENSAGFRENDERTGSALGSRKRLRLSATLYAPGRKKIAILVPGFRAEPEFAFAIWSKYLYDNGFSMLLLNQRAHPGSDGSFITMGIREADDVKVWADYTQKLYPDADILLLGMSMGGASVLFTENLPSSVKAMICDCPFTSPAHQLARISRKMKIPPFIMVPPFVAVGRIITGVNLYRNATGRAIKNPLPLFIIAGDKDSTVDFKTTDAIMKYKKNAERLIVEGAEHSVAFAAGGNDAEKAALEFLNKYFEV